MKKITYWLPILLLFIAMKDKPAYQLFTAEGKTATYEKMLKELAQADVVLFGEQHNDPIGHWLQRELAQDLYLQHRQQFVLGAEMFETDVQLVLDEFLKGQVPESNFEAEARPWQNYSTDYKPVVLLAKEHGIPFIATNVPRRYAAMVAKQGPAALDSVSAAAKQFLAPLPLQVDYELPGYKNMIGMFGSSHGNRGQQIVAAQALKDATMAHFIVQNLNNGKKMLHLNGSYHSDNHDGIVAYLRQYAPQLKIKTISTVNQKEVKALEKEHLKKADFILAVPATMTKTY